MLTGNEDYLLISRKIKIWLLGKKKIGLVRSRLGYDGEAIFCSYIVKKFPKIKH